MLRHKCLDVLKVRRRHPFLASGTFSPAWGLELMTNKAPCASSQMQINPRHESDGDFCYVALARGALSKFFSKK